MESSSKNKTKNSYFNPNLKQEPYQTINDNIKELFTTNDRNYLSFLNSVKDPILKEIIVLLRKYQQTFEYVKLNTDFIYNSTTKETNDLINDNYLNSSFILNKIKLYELNSFKFKVSIIPRLRKSDISIEVNEDIISLIVTVAFNIDQKTYDPIINESLTSFTVLNQTNMFFDFEKKKNNILLNFLTQKLVDYTQKNIIGGVNNFLSYFENHLEDIVNYQKKNDNKIKSDIWSQQEQDLLERGLVKYKDENNVAQKFIKIGLYVGTKTGKQCLNRYKELRLKLQEQLKNEEEINMIKKEQEQKILDKGKKQDENLNNNNTSNNINNNNNKDKKKENKIDYNKFSAFIPEEINPQKNSLLAIVDDIVKEFGAMKTKILDQRNALNIRLNEAVMKKIESKISQRSNTANADNKIENDNEEEEKEEYDNENDFNNNEDDNDITEIKINNTNCNTNNTNTNKGVDSDLQTRLKIKNPFDEEHDEKEKKVIQSLKKQACAEKTSKLLREHIKGAKSNFNYRFAFSNNTSDHIKYLLNNSDRYIISSDSTTLINNIALLSSDICIYAGCNRCKRQKFKCNFIDLTKKSKDWLNKVYYFGAFCDNCGVNMYMIIRPSLLHLENNHSIARIFAFNCQPIQYGLASYLSKCIECMEISDDAFTVIEKKDVLPTRECIYNCRTCLYKIQLKFMHIYVHEDKNSYNTILDSEITKFKSSDYTEFSNLTQYSNLITHDKFDIMTTSSDLSNLKSGCEHMRSSHKWYRFACCYLIFPCIKCHQNGISANENHIPSILSCVCCYCHTQQTPDAIKCIECNKILVTESKGNHWEGGKGQRNKAFLSSKDNAKFRGLNKTIPNKKK